MARKARSEPESMWYRLGYALEAAREPARLRSLVDRLPGRKDAEAGERRPARARREGGKEGDGDALDALLAAGAGTLAVRMLDLWPTRRRPGMAGLLRAGAAGAGAALLRQLLRPLLDGRRPHADDLAEALAAGAARGLLYAAVVEPRLPGSPVVRGAMYGGLEYAVSPWGGLNGILGRKAPLGKLTTGLFEGYDPADDTLADHVTFAVALAVLYGEPSGDGEEPRE